MDDRIYDHRSNAKGKCMRNLRSEGNAGERIAGLFLEQHGVRILERNFRSGRQGEIDLIGFEQDTLGKAIMNRMLKAAAYHVINV